MLLNYLTVALRHLRRNRIYALINLLGLSLGLGTFMVIFFYVVYHRGFDTYHKDAGRIIRIGMEAKLGGELILTSTVGAPAAKVLLNELPGIEDATRLFSRQQMHYEITRGEQVFGENQTMFADRNFFKFFSIPAIAGDPAEMLSEPNSIVLTAVSARKIFGDEVEFNSLPGEILEVENIGPVKITGVIEDVPAQTHFTFDILLSNETNPKAKNAFWLTDGFHTYLKLHPAVSASQLAEKYPQLVEKYIGTEVKQFLGVSYSEFTSSGGSIRLHSIPLTDIHLWSNFNNELRVNINGTYINIFLGVGILILLLAIINFVNLTAATNIRRLKEVGLRKVMGASRSSLIWQFILEAWLITLFSFGAGFTIHQVATPLIGQYFAVDTGSGHFSLIWYIWIGLAGSIVIGATAGIYPALLLSSTATTAALKGTTSLTTRKSTLRGILSTIQFSISIGLLACVLVMYTQVNYLKNKPLGFEKDQVILLNGIDKLGEKSGSLRQELAQVPGITAVSLTSYAPAGPGDINQNAVHNPEEETPQTHRATNVSVDEHYLEAMGMQLVAGRNFSIQYGDEAANVIINVTLAMRFGWEPDEALGHVFLELDEKESYRIIGVVDDFHFLNMADPITPFFFRYSGSNSMAAVRFNAEDLPAVQHSIEAVWQTFSQEPIQLTHLDEHFQRHFEKEHKVSSLFQLFTVLAIALSAMGLFAMSAFHTAQRTKEVGIRKVLGAEGKELFVLLSKQVLWIILAAAIIATPFVLFAMDRWLQDYTYRTNFEIWTIALPVFGMVVFSLCVNGWHVVKAIRINPVETLRSE